MLTVDKSVSSNVSGAFDKVSRNRLLCKLRAKGIHPKLVKVIGSWLEPRRASVVLGGETSSSFRIKDMLFQGTVLGPQLWDLFFEDAASAINECLYEEIIFADDLNAYKVVSSLTSVDSAMESLGNVEKKSCIAGVLPTRSLSILARRVNTCSLALPHTDRILSFLVWSSTANWI